MYSMRKLQTMSGSSMGRLRYEAAISAGGMA